MFVFSSSKSGGSSGDEEIHFEDLASQDQLMNWMQGMIKRQKSNVTPKFFT